MDVSSDIIKQKFDALPEETKRVLLSDRRTLIFLKIAAKHGLSDEQKGALGRLSSHVVMGIIGRGDLPARLGEALHVDKARAELVAKDLGTEYLDRMNTLAYTPDLTEEEFEAEMEKLESANPSSAASMQSLSILDQKLDAAQPIPPAPEPTVTLATDPVPPQPQPASQEPGATPPAAPAQNSAPQTETSAPEEQKKSYSGTDPYREPI